MAETQKRPTNYAGIAALITAVTGSAALLLTQMDHENRTKAVQESVLTVLQYRIEQLERLVEKQDEEIVRLRIKLAARLGRRFLPDGPELDEEAAPVTESRGAPPPSSAPIEGQRHGMRDLITKVRGKATVNFQDIQQAVEQRGAPLERSDLER